jgi:hypothetical protein
MIDVKIDVDEEEKKEETKQNVPFCFLKPVEPPRANFNRKWECYTIIAALVAAAGSTTRYVQENRLTYLRCLFMHFDPDEGIKKIYQWDTLEVTMSLFVAAVATNEEHKLCHKYHTFCGYMYDLVYAAWAVGARVARLQNRTRKCFIGHVRTALVALVPPDSARESTINIIIEAFHDVREHQIAHRRERFIYNQKHEYSHDGGMTLTPEQCRRVTAIVSATIQAVTQAVWEVNNERRSRSPARGASERSRSPDRGASERSRSRSRSP